MKGCSCGIYAVTSFEQLRKAATTGASPIALRSAESAAEVKLWGRIRKGQIGFRAEHPYPKVFVRATQLLLGRIVRERYGCELGVIDRFTGRTM